MFLNQLAVLLSLATPLALFSLGPLELGTPVPISLAETGNSPVDVSGDESGFMATWVDNTGSVWTSFSNTQGRTWQLTGIIPSAMTGFYSRIARGPIGTLVTWGNQTPGGPNETATAAFSTSNGEMWQVSEITATLIGAYDIPICATDGGFLTTFPFPVGGGHYSAVSVFSSDGTSWQSVETISVDHINGTFSPTAAYNGSIFMAAWVNSDGTALFSTSADAMTWGMPLQIGTVANVNSEVSLIAVGSGFLATWADTSGNAYSSYTDSEGMAWTTPSPIAFNVNTTPFPTVLASGTASGLIATWDGTVGADNTAYASVSNDLGTTWSTPATMVSAFDDYNGTFDLNFIGVSVVGNTYLFTWIDNSDNIYSVSSPAAGGGSRPFYRPSNNR